MYAVNLADLTAHKDLLPLRMLLLPVIDTDRTPVNCERKRIDGMSMILACPDDRAQAICKVIRRKLLKHQLRIYFQAPKSRRWKRI